MVRSDHAETERFFRLPDLWMGADLLRFSRRMRSLLPDEIAGPACCTVERRMLWDIIPAISARLGISNFLPNEALAMSLRGLDTFDFRHETTAVLTGLPKHPGYDAPHGWSLVTRDVCKGNILAIALDRAAPPAVASDWIAATIDKACNDRGIPARLTWMPELLEPSAQSA